MFDQDCSLTLLSLCPSAGLDLTSVAEDPSFTGSGGCGQRTVQEEPLDAILSPELDKMVTDGESGRPALELFCEPVKLIRSHVVFQEQSSANSTRSQVGPPPPPTAETHLS